MSRWVFLSGMMGSGKSTVGRVLAEREGARFVDLDARIVAREGASIAELFEARGEAEFRRLEADEAERLLSEEGPAVVALGGGTVTRLQTRRMLLKKGVLVTLTASAEELARRLRATNDRPLLGHGDAVSILKELLAERNDAYAECHGLVDTQGRSADALAREVQDIVRARPIVVPLGGRSYRVEVGRGVRRNLADHVDRLAPGAIVLVTDENVRETWARSVAEALAGRSVSVVSLPPGETHKTLASVEQIWSHALEAGVDRSALVLAVGGGVVGDMAGFAASTLLRGVRFIQVPTTSLAMVDASVGGKTGFDRPQGKNLIGSFHQPELVLCDIETLSTLPEPELRAGLAEVLKSAWIDGEAAVRALEEDAAALTARDGDALERAVRMSVRLKADVVAGDERESGRRAVLNLGHTIGHAIEAARGYSGIRHGEAVALGMMAAFRVARALGDAEAQARQERLRALLERLALPTDLDAWLDAGTLDFVGADKKRVGESVRFVVPHEPGRVTVVPLALTELRRMLHG